MFPKYLQTYYGTCMLYYRQTNKSSTFQIKRDKNNSGIVRANGGSIIR